MFPARGGMSRRRAAGVPILALLAAGMGAPDGPVRAAERVSAPYVALELGYNSGDFGTGVRTDLYTTRATIGLIAPSYDLSLVLPYHRLEDDTGYSQSGLGDVTLHAGRLLIQDRNGAVSLNGSLLVKLPTADETRGLGTGETDAGGELSLSRRWRTVTATLRAGYLQIGDPPGIDYNDVLLYGASVSALIHTTGVYVSLDGSSATLDDLPDPLALRGGLFHPLSSRYLLSADLTLGLSDGSADYGGNFGVIRWLD